MSDEQSLIIQNADALITIKQLPVIEQQLAKLKPEIEAYVSQALSLPVNDETVKEIKKFRAELRAKFDALEAERKRIKEAVAKPYNDMEAVYKECVSKLLTDADTKLKEKIAEVEDAQKKEREEAVSSFFNEYALSKNVGFLSFEQSGIKVLLSTSEKQLKDSARAYIDAKADGVALINSEPEHAAEMMVEFKKTLNASSAILTVRERYRAIEEEKARQAEREKAKQFEEERQRDIDKRLEEQIAHVVPAPIAETPKAPDENEVLEITFTVKDTRKKIRALREYMIKENINYGK
jgi:predicted secreted protein